jgi:DNA repair protein RadA/Sms
VVLVCGEPGVGKSTLLLDAAARVAAGHRVLYLSGEETAAQVRLRAERIGACHPGLLLAAATDLSQILGHIEATRPALLVLDSVQVVTSEAVGGQPGSVAQVREVAAALVEVAKAHTMTTLLVGHVTKDGSVAGPRTLEHLVDVVCQFEGDRHTPLRLVRALKNRFGPTDEVGCFQLGETGLIEVDDPSALFCTHPREPAAGSSICVTLDGRRPLLVEVQALVAPSAGAPRRATHGVDPGRAAIVAAVLTNRLGLPLASMDTFISTIGGASAREPASDLALALALASAALKVALPPRCAAIGEIGLTGEIRPVAGMARRLGEAARLGFTRAIVPRGTAPVSAAPTLEIVEIDDVLDVVDTPVLGLAAATTRRPSTRGRTGRSGTGAGTTSKPARPERSAEAS